MKRLICLLLVSLCIVGLAQAGDVNNAKDTAYRINETVSNKLPMTITMTHDQIVKSGYNPTRGGDYTLLIKSMYYDEYNGTLVTYINGWNNQDPVTNPTRMPTILHIHNPVRWYMPFDDDLTGAALQQAYVQMVVSYLDSVPFGEPVDDDTLIVYPNVDGYAEDTTASAYLTLRGDTGASATVNSSSTMTAPIIDTSPSAGTYHIFRRGVLVFDTSTLPDASTISSAKFTLYVTATTNDLGSPGFGITGGTLADNTTIASGDYDGFGNTRYASDIAYASISTSARNNWSLNAAGLANVSKVSPTVIYFRDSWDIDASTTGLGTTKNSNSGISWNPVNYVTSSQRPYLEVIYAAATESAFSANVSSGTEPLPVAFTDSTLNTPTNWDWYFGNGTKFSDSQNPTVTLMQGTYTINLYTSNAGGGDWENKTNYITVNAAPAGDEEYGNWTDFIVNSTTSLTDFQVKLILDNSTGTNIPGKFYTNGTTRGDWADIKFTNITNSTLAFWKENRTEGATNSTWWIKVPSIADDNTTKIRLFYGNASQTTSYMDMNSTFLFSDDFPGTSLDTTNKWIQNSGTQTVSDSISTWSGTSATVYSRTSVGSSSVTEMRYKTAHDNNAAFYEAFWVSENPIGNKYLSMTPCTPAGPVDKYSQSNLGSRTDITITNWSANTYAKVTLVDTGTTSRWYINNKLDANFTTSDYPVSATRYYYFGVASDASASLSMDWIALRKYTATEPFLTVNVSGGGGGTPSAPVASFTVNKQIARIPQPITVTDTSTNTPTSWQWSWGDGTANSTTQNPSHTYTKRGKFDIYLTATNANGSGTTATATSVRVVGYENYY